MTYRTLTSLTALCFLSAGPIWAEATEAGAAELKAALQTYLGDTEGVVSVALAGADYAVTLDLVPLLSVLPADGMTGAASPVVALVTDKGDGTWDYVIDQPFSFTYDVAGVLSATTSYDSLQGRGTFDVALGDMRAYAVTARGMNTSQTQTDPQLGEITTTSSADSLVWEGGAAPGANGVDGQFTAVTTGITFDTAFPTEAGMPPMQIRGKVANGTASGLISGYQPKALYGLLAFAVAHPGEAQMEADKSGLKAAIEAALPVFDSAAVSGAYTGISVETMLGTFGLDEAGFAFDMNGVTADGRLREAFTLKGLTLPEGLVPPFAMPLIPQEISMDMAVSGFDPAAAAKLALGLLDLPDGAATPEDFSMQMLMALMPQGAVDLTLAPGGVMGAGYGLTYEGAMRAGMGGMPTGTAKITLRGIDTIMAALGEAPPEMAAQALPFLGMAQAMGQAGPEGELVWDIDAGALGSLKINGMDMMGGP